jgi:hypothetical protein
MKRVAAFVGTLSTVALVLAIAAQTTSTAKDLDGQHIFRYDTFGDEQLWTNTLQMQQAIAAVSPRTALKVGLKVDAEALPPALVDALPDVDLDDPAVTLQLLSLNAVVGVIGRVGTNGLESIGLTCAFCHSTVDNSIMTGIGRRLDGWPNRDLNVGAIVALSPMATEAQKLILNSWGPGKFDPRLRAFDGMNFIPLNSPSLPVVIPPAYGLRHVGFETFTGDGPISYWNNYVGVTQMGGQGSFHDSRIGLHITQTPDLVTPKLPALLDYQLSLRAPEPPAGSFNREMARRGRQVFRGAGRCAECHLPPAFTDVLSRRHGNDIPLLHAPGDVGAEGEYASRSATGLYRTTPLAGIWQHPPYFHDGSAATLLDVVKHYETETPLSIDLTPAEEADLVEYLKSL